MSARWLFVPALVALSGCNFEAAYQAYCERAGCGPATVLTDAGEEDAGVAPPSFTAATYCDVQAGTYCDQLVRCGQMAAAEASRCRLSLARSCLDFQSRPAAANALAFSTANGSRCLTALVNAGCETLPVVGQGFCDGIFTADAGLADRCLFDDFCEGGRICAGAAGLTCGRCEPKRTSFGPCVHDGHCQPSHFCGSNPDGGLTDVCRLRSADGTLCAIDSECQSDVCNVEAGNQCGASPRNGPCQRGKDCAAGDYCLLDRDAGSPVGACAARLGEGDPCVNRFFDDGCPSGQSCLDGACKALPFLSRPNGAECENNEQCQSYFCVGTNFQTYRSGQCQLPPPAGDPCPDGACRSGAVCLGGVCQARKAAGAACEANLQGQTLGDGPCLLFLSCEGDGGVIGACVPAGRIGEACSPTNRCVEGLCDGGVCEALRPAGAPCASGDVCESSVCPASTDGGTQSCAALCF